MTGYDRMFSQYSIITMLFRLSRRKRFCNNEQAAEHLLDPYRSTIVGSSYIAVEDDGTVVFYHSKL